MTTQETYNKPNNGGLGIRSITAIAFVLIMLGGVFLGAYPFVILFGLIATISLWEFACIVFPSNDLFHRISCVILGILPYFFLALYHLNCPGTCQPAILFSSMIAIFTLFTSELYAKSAEPFRNVGMVLLGVVYISLPFMLLNLIAFEAGTYEYKTVLGLMLMVWTNDTAAYLLGKRFGSTPLMEKISPKKTWEGTIGGGVFTLIVGYSLSRLFDNISLVDWMVLALIVIIFGSYGDLIESMLKRSYGIKDSSNLLPGHGGFLDRFDAFIYMLPFAATYLLWIK